MYFLKNRDLTDKIFCSTVYTHCLVDINKVYVCIYNNCLKEIRYSNETHYVCKKICGCLKILLIMSKKMILGQKNIQSTIVGFLAKTTSKKNILQSR